MTAAFAIAVALSVQQPTQPAPSPAPADAAQGWTDDRPLTRMLPNLQRDLKAFPRFATLGIVGAGALGAAASSKVDDRISSWVQCVGGERAYTPIGSVIGNEWIQGGAAIAAYTIGVVQDSPELAHIGSDLIRAQLLNGVFTMGLKVAASRTRPSGGDLSFPSGHTSATFASATVLAEHYGWKVGLPAYAMASFIGWTRIRNHEHYLSDVVFGTAIGIAAGKTVTLGHKPGRFTVVPVVVPGGGGVFFVRNAKFKIQE
jgi:membrane-associated phospholipid phosphatase